MFVTVHLERPRTYQHVRFWNIFSAHRSHNFSRNNRKEGVSFLSLLLFFLESAAVGPRKRLTGGGEDKIMEVGLTGI
jgi:hypothetical protein